MIDCRGILNIFASELKKCKRKTRRGRYLCVDHCHVRQKVRALLCHPCNTGLGSFDDDAERMREGADYLDRANGVPLPPCRCRPGDIPGGGYRAWQQPVVGSTIVLRCAVGRFRVNWASRMCCPAVPSSRHGGQGTSHRLDP
jgi:hypothetical protein